jgi:biopolymer transport protein ExbD
MPKLTMPKKSTSIDMTALCDFTLLLLTFFIMSSKFKPQEPVEVRTPASTSTKEIPMGFLQITLDKDGRVFFAVDNINVKRSVITDINTNKGLGLSENEINNYINGPSVGVPFTRLKSYLALTPSQQSDYDKQAPGIPTDTTGNFTTNELAYWIQTTRLQLPQARIVIKADGDAPYPEINKIISTLGKMKIFRFSFITNAKAIPPGTALYEEQNTAKSN